MFYEVTFERSNFTIEQVFVFAESRKEAKDKVRQYAGPLQVMEVWNYHFPIDKGSTLLV